MIERTEAEIKKSLGNNILKFRILLGISQEELSFRAGLHRNYVSDAERGQRNVSLLALYRIAHGLEIPLKELMDI